jgi:hypothetical protein
LRDVGRQRQRAVIPVHSLLEAAEPPEDVGQVAAGPRVRRIEFDRP